MSKVVDHKKRNLTDQRRNYTTQRNPLLNILTPLTNRQQMQTQLG